MIVTAIVSVTASSGFWGYFIKKHDGKSAKTRLLIGLAHDRILQAGTHYTDRGWITDDEYENLYDYLYTPYKELGGNGTAERVIEAVKKLPRTDPTLRAMQHADA